MLIILVGFELLKTSIGKIVTPTLPTVGNITLILLGVAILVKVWLFFFYRNIAKRISSSALKASAADSLSDCVATSLVLISALVGRYAGIAVDGWAGLVVAVFILFTGVKASKETIDLLLGSPPDKAFIDSIYAFVDNKERYPRIVGIHDVMVHDYGPGRQIVSFHAEVPSDSDINIAHEEVDQLERDMHEKFGCIVTVHLDPITVNDPVVEEFKTLASECAKELGQDCSIHDFRMTKGETQINLIFDLVLPVDCKLSAKDAVGAVAEEIAKRDSRCNCVIRPEHPFV
jgi:cation diffusion facilitator family transporter